MIKEVTSEAVYKRKRSDTLFILGSGYSINDLTPGETQEMSKCDTLSFSWTIYQNLIRMDFHMIREISMNDLNPSLYEQELRTYSEVLKKNPLYENALFILQIGWNAMRMVIYDYLPPGAECLLYANDKKGTQYPNSEFKLGLAHGPSTLFDCINFGYLFGWKRIALVGIDLYDRRYFWLKPDEARYDDVINKRNYLDVHNTARETVIWAKRWHKCLRKRGVELFVYNPKSLLAKSIPVFAPRG